MISKEKGCVRKFIKNKDVLYEVVTMVYEKDLEYLEAKKKDLEENNKTTNKEQVGLNLKEIAHIDVVLNGADESTISSDWESDSEELIASGENYRISKNI